MPLRRLIVISLLIFASLVAPAQQRPTYLDT